MNRVCLFSFAVAALGLGAATAAEKAKPVPPGFPQVKLPAPAEGDVDLNKLRGKEATILVFLSTECPISNGYVPAINRLAEEHKEQGVAVIALFPNQGQSLKQIEAHARQFEIRSACLKDVGAAVAEQLQVNRCPEACLFDKEGKLRYQGRIDDRYVKRGGAPLDVRSADLSRAVEELLAGKEITTARTESLGCPIEGRREAQPAAKGEVVFSRHIAPLLQKHCQECHRPGGIGPFSLTTYDDAVRWSGDIEDFTERGIMPPWKAVAPEHAFANERAMSKEERQAIAKWVAAGCPRGDDQDLPPPRKFAEGWRSGTPDLILEMPEPYVIGAEGPDIYRCFVLPTGQTEDRHVVALEVLPGNPKVVHHVIAFLDESGAADKLDADDPGPGYATSGGYPGFVPSGGLGGWAPGNVYVPLPAGMAKIMPVQAKVVLQVHYHRSGKEERDQTRIGIYYSKVPVDRPVFNITLLPLEGPLGSLRIPAGNGNYEVKTAMVLPDELWLLGITPHMHLIGKDMTVNATLPGAKAAPLIQVEDWDFNWQESYRYKEPQVLPKGTRLDLSAHFDNSAANPYNPSHPPQEMRWGEQTTNEMCIAFLEVVRPQKVLDRSQLREPTREERVKFVLEARRLAGENVDVSKLPWFRSLGGSLRDYFPGKAAPVAEPKVPPRE